MKINKDCARKVLLEIEKLPYGDSMSVETLQEKIKDFTIDEVLNAVSELNRNRYISMLGKQSWDDTDVFRDNRVKSLTDKGSRALDTIRDDNTWNDMKNKLSNFDDLSIYTIFDLALRIEYSKTNELFGISDSLNTNVSRW